MKEIGPEDHAAGRSLLIQLGVSNETLDAAGVDDPGFNWITLVWALDGIFLGWGGMAAQAAFLRDPQPDLGGRTAGEVLVDDDGPELVCEAARAYARQGPLHLATPEAVRRR